MARLLGYKVSGLPHLTFRITARLVPGLPVPGGTRDRSATGDQLSLTNPGYLCAITGLADSVNVQGPPGGMPCGWLDALLNLLTFRLSVLETDPGKLLRPGSGR